ncbi:phosphate ABC transporter permease PstA [Ligilactobacillus equi]|nr:phosphate ABC transporter permease PstA [Ligilactobacillus equi]
MDAHRMNRLVLTLIKTVTYIVVAALVLLLVYIIGKGLPHLSWHFLGSESQAFLAGGGIRNQLFDSFYILLLTLVISTPLALLAAIFLAFYAPQNSLTDLVRTTIEVLSSLPSIVVGLFAYLLFVVNFQMGFSLLAGALALTIFNLPILTRNFEDALAEIDETQMQGGLALGFSKWKAITQIILPAALPSLITGMILGAGRIFGEAAALIFTAGQSPAQVDFNNWNPFSSTSFLNIMRPAETLAVHIWKLNSEGLVQDAALVSAASATVLVLMVIIFNAGARILGSYLQKKMMGGK